MFPGRQPPFLPIPSPSGSKASSSSSSSTSPPTPSIKAPKPSRHRASSSTSMAAIASSIAAAVGRAPSPNREKGVPAKAASAPAAAAAAPASFSSSAAAPAPAAPITIPTPASSTSNGAPVTVPPAQPPAPIPPVQTPQSAPAAQRQQVAVPGVPQVQAMAPIPASAAAGLIPRTPAAPAPAANDNDSVKIPPLLANGVLMVKVSSKKMKRVTVRLSPTAITWPSLKGGKVDITSIRELRLGQSPTEEYSSHHWITIVYVRDKQWKVVHFIAYTPDVYALWVKALHELVSESSDKVVSGAQGPASDPELRFIRQLWPAGVTSIDKAAAAGLCAQLGVVVPPPILAKYEFPLDLARFRQLVRDVQTRPELGEIYQRLGGTLPRDKVRVFLKDVQGEADVDADAVFAQFACKDKPDEWSAESLASYLSSPENVPKSTQDFSRPLPEYYIASSHNTYLVAEQWRGSSTVEGYIRVLLAGCRSVEIDVHDGGSEGPIVYHGMTITSSVSVRDVCQAINKYAFVASPYPVILSLEIRCSVEQQDRLAVIIKECFGERLVTCPIDADHLAKVPSPENLKGRILIKTKPMPVPTSPGSILSQSPTLSPPLLSPPPAIASSPPKHSQDSTTDSTTESDSSFVRLARKLSLSTGPNKTTPQGHSRHLTDLPVYTAAVKYQGFTKLVTYDFNHMFSVSERTAHRILKDGQEADWVKHNFSHLTRVYPKGVRLTSSNFDPRPFWTAGAQLVAINYQTQDDGSLYNDALFHSGGYVLKPLSLRQKVIETTQKYKLHIQVISAQRLPPTGDMYVEVTVGEDTFRTKSTRGASLTPRWDEGVEFIVESKPSLLGLTFIHMAIRLPRGLLAQWTRPLADTGRGYRYLPLSDRDRSKYLFATLFVRIDVVPLAAGVPKPKSQGVGMAFANAVK